MKFDLRELGQDALQQIVEEILRCIELKEEGKIPKKPKFFVLFPKKLNVQCYILLEFLKEKGEYVYDAVIPDEMSGEEISFLVQSCVFQTIHKLSHILEHSIELENLLIVVMPRNNVIRLSQCLCEDEIDLLIKRQFERAHGVWLFSKGMEKLTMKEPSKYSQKVLGYYKEIFEFGIKLFDV